ncbi:hypothetical protein QUB60_06675 [Microcoleus sp. A2-C5]|uniref:hypothetical protein n=1 Tax=unclassified Microcoleus TaxID=2642155 RepID=UPI002FD3A3D6
MPASVPTATVFPAQFSPNSQQLIIVNFHATVFSSNSVKAAIAAGFPGAIVWAKRVCYILGPEIAKLSRLRFRSSSKPYEFSASK